MKKLKYIIAIIVICILVIIGIEFFKKDEKEKNTTNTSNVVSNTNTENTTNEVSTNNTTNKNENNTSNEQNSVETKEIKNGTELLEKAEKKLEARGWAGASNNVIGLKDGTIYYYNKGTEEFRKVATGIKDIYYNEENPEEIIVKHENNFKKIGEDIEYLVYEQN